jgi:hypothetical protein
MADSQDERLEWCFADGVQCADVAEAARLLRFAAEGRRAYARNAPKEQADLLEWQAHSFESAAGLIEDPGTITLLVPTWMQVAR